MSNIIQVLPCRTASWLTSQQDSWVNTTNYTDLYLTDMDQNIFK